MDVSLEESASKTGDDILRIDVVTTPAYIHGSCSSVLDINLCMTLGRLYKQYPRVIGRDTDVVGVQIKASGFKLVMTPEQISGILLNESARIDFESYFIDVIDSLIPKKFKGKLLIHSNPTTKSSDILACRETILSVIRSGRDEDHCGVCDTSPSKLTQSQTVSLDRPVFVAKATVKVVLLVDAVYEALSPRMVEASRPVRSSSLYDSSSPRGSSPRPVASVVPQHPSPRNDSSPRNASPRETTFRSVLKRVSSRFFSIHDSSKLSPRNASSPELPASPKRSNSISLVADESSKEPSSTMLSTKSGSYPGTSPQLKSVHSSVTVQRDILSDGPNAERVTQVNFSPRGRASTTSGSDSAPLKNTEPELRVNIIPHCEQKIIAWCQKKSFSYEKEARVFRITLDTQNEIVIEREYIQLGSEKREALELFVQLIRELPYVDYVKLGDKMPDAVHEFILAGLKQPIAKSDEKVSEEMKINPGLN